MPSYEYQVENCDVEVKSRLQAYRNLRLQWIDDLQRESATGVWQQLIDMTWNEMFWRAINEARGISLDATAKNIGVNGYFCNFVDRGYVHMQSLTIRRMCDKRADVSSIASLLRKMKKKKFYFTREIFVSFDGLPYNYAPIREKWQVELLQKIEASGSGTTYSGVTSGPQAWESSERRHKLFDKIVGTRKPAERQRYEHIPESFFSKLEKRLRTCDSFIRFANNFLAHSSEPSERFNSLRTLDKEYSLRRSLVCQRILLQTALFIDAILLDNTSSSFTASTIGNPFEHFELGLVPNDGTEEVRSQFDAFREQIENWSNLRWFYLTES